MWTLLQINSSRIRELILILLHLHASIPIILLGTLPCALSRATAVIMVEAEVFSSILKLNWVLFLYLLLFRSWLLILLDWVVNLILVVDLVDLLLERIENLVLCWAWNLRFRWDEAWLALLNWHRVISWAVGILLHRGKVVQQIFICQWRKVLIVVPHHIQWDLLSIWYRLATSSNIIIQPRYRFIIEVVNQRVFTCVTFLYVILAAFLSCIGATSWV